MSQRLSRKQIKEDIRHDEVQTALTSTYESLQKHRNLAIGVAVGIVVLGIGFAITRSVMAKSAEASAVELAQAIRLYDAPINEESPKPDDPFAPSFKSAEERRARAREAMSAIGGGAGDLASLYLANLAMSDGDTAAARGYWETFLRDNSGHILATSVRLSLLRLDREEGRAAEIVEELQAELDVEPKSLPEDVLLFELAETLVTLDRGEEAEEYYQRILDDYPQSAYSAQAREKTTG